MSGRCGLCEEDVQPGDEAPTVLHTPQGARIAHKACMLREVVGGIGHLIAHDYWCVQHHDTDAGLTRRQSAQLVWVYSLIVGLEPTKITEELT